MKLKWEFNYEGKHLVNEMRENASCDFSFFQNNNQLFMGQGGERSFLGLLIYSMQKIKSPEEAKADLEKRIKNIENYNLFQELNSEPLCFMPYFVALDKFGEIEIGDYNSSFPVAKVDNNLKISRFGKERIILPYSELLKSVDNLIIGINNKMFNTTGQEAGEIIDYYISENNMKYSNISSV